VRKNWHYEIGKVVERIKILGMFGILVILNTHSEAGYDLAKTGDLLSKEMGMMLSLNGVQK